MLVVTGSVNAPIEDVFAAATDWPRQSDWIPFTTVQVARGDGRSVGSLIKAYTGIGPAGFLDLIEVTGWEPPRRVDVLHVGRLLRGPGAFEFRELTTGRTAFAWSEWLHPPLGKAGELGWLAVRPLVAAGFRRSLRGFARSAATR